MFVPAVRTLVATAHTSAAEWVEKPVLPKGSAKIACIVDYHYEVVANEASADIIICSNGGETTYYKEGELEVVAHSETTLDGSSEVIVCNKKNSPRSSIF